MKEWRINLVNARIAKDGDPQMAKIYSDRLTVNVLRTLRISDPESWAELKNFIEEAES